jgi:hypothetical protein
MIEVVEDYQIKHCKHQKRDRSAGLCIADKLLM